MATKPKFATYQEFWKFYLQEHSKPETKKFHAIGLMVGILFFLFCYIDRRPLWYPFALVFGYSFAWYSHYFIEKNKPATFRYPLWSLISDFRMTYLWLTKKI
jgi:hypothetical protein